MILIIDCGSNKTKYIEQIVYEFMDTRLTSLMDFQDSDLEGVKGVILSGAPLLVTEIDTTPYEDKMKWILTIEVPVFGICFGHQLIVGLYYARLFLITSIPF
jgi:GMP synthase (glutamine-hydrolysing)